jgi:chromosome segregation ATPase
VRKLHYFNLAGVLALLAICILQWVQNRNLNLDVNRLEAARLEAASKLAETQKSERDLAGDLSELKAHLERSQTNSTDARQKLGTLERDLRQRTAERDQLLSSVTNWAAAVIARDEKLKEANGQIHRLAEELNSSITRFNNLATNYNAVVKDFNELQRQLKGAGGTTAAPPTHPGDPAVR